MTLANILKEKPKVISKGSEEDIEIRYIDDTTTDEDIHANSDREKLRNISRCNSRFSLYTVSAVRKVLGNWGKTIIGLEQKYATSADFLDTLSVVWWKIWLTPYCPQSWFSSMPGFPKGTPAMSTIVKLRTDLLMKRARELLKLELT